MQEYEAAEKLTELLEAEGFTVERGAAGLPTAFTAVWGKGCPVLAFSSEYDALPGLSQKKDSTSHDPVIPMAVNPLAYLFFIFHKSSSFISLFCFLQAL